MTAKPSQPLAIKKILLLVATLVIVATAAFLIERRAATTAPLVALGEVSSIELKLHGTPAGFKREGKVWRLDSFDGKPVFDPRANQNLIEHLVDLVKALRDEAKTALDAKDAEAYGMRSPELSLTLHWQKPEPGTETVHFGHRDLSGRKVFAWFPARPLLVEAPAYAVMLLHGKIPLDLRDRHVTTFDVDDVEDLKMSGKCGALIIARDGDRWLRNGKPLAPEKAEAWLKRLLEVEHDGLEAPGSDVDRPGENPVCAIALAGRRGRAERLEIFKAGGTLWAKNDRLSGVYRLPTGILSALVTP